MVKNGRTYLYEIRSYRDQGKVKQESRYMGIETEIDGQRIIKAPKNRTPVREDPLVIRIHPLPGC